MLGFGTLGELALGQLPSISSGPSFSSFSSDPTPRKLPIAVVSTTYVGFVPVQVRQPTVFTSFSQPSAKKQITHNQGFVTQPVAQVVTVTPVFTGFSQPQPTKVRPQTDLTTQLQPIVVATTVVAGGDFSDFDLVQTKKNLQQGFTGFVFAPPVVTPVFSKFSDPQYSKVRPQSDTARALFQAPVVVTTVTGNFADFSLVQNKKSQQQGFTGFVFTPPVQTTVFSRFEQPFTKRVLQQDYSFVNLPVVQVVTQPFVFSDFGMPKKAGLIQPDFLSTPTFLTPVVTTVNFSGFSDFGVPKKSGIIQQDFLNSPIPPVVQNYVFTQFSQPQIVKVYREGFTNAPFVASDIRYIFSPFEQPQSKKILQVDQSFVNLPVIVQVVQPYVFSPFEQPQFKRSPQLDASVQFEVLQPAFVPSVVVFTGFSDFGYVLHPSYLAALQSGISYDIIVPTPEELIVFAGRWHKLEGGLKPNVVKLDSTNIAEVAHNRNSNELVVKFQNDKVYHYSNVDANKVKSLVNAKSSGGYLHDQIKGKYFTTRIK